MNIEVKVIAGARKREIRLDGARLKVKLISKPVESCVPLATSDPAKITRPLSLRTVAWI